MTKSIIDKPGPIPAIHRFLFSHGWPATLAFLATALFLGNAPGAIGNLWLVFLTIGVVFLVASSLMSFAEWGIGNLRALPETKQTVDEESPAPEPDRKDRLERWYYDHPWDRDEG